MGKWNDALKEAQFKRVQDGFIFKTPGFAPRYYLVSEAQKAAIQKLMRRSGNVNVFLGIFLGILWIALGLGYWSGGYRGEVLSWVGLGINFMILQHLPPAAMVGKKQLGPVLAGARYTEQRITWRERDETFARMLPISVALLLGVASLACALLSASIGAVIALQPYDLTIVPPVFLIVMSIGVGGLFLLMAARFFYLVILRFVLARQV